MPRAAQTAFEPRFMSGLPPVSRLLVGLGLTLARWDARQSTRKALKELDARLLQDIGLNEAAQDREAQKPFWRA